MDKKLLLLFISLLLTLPTVQAQNILDLIDLPEEKATTPAVQALSTHQQTNQPPAVPDTVYCTSTMKRHGWQEPFHIISKEDARYINSVIRLTQPDKNGHYHKMELIDAYGRYAPNNNLSPYILKLWSADTDQSANQEWVKRLKTQCIVETVSDAQDRVVQERAYDENHHIIFTYSRTPIGKDAHGHERYVGSYHDFYGLPAEMRNDWHYTYGTLVLLTEDRCGYDSIIQFIDAKGFLKLNDDSVAMEVYEHDAQGRILRSYSCDHEGHKMRDNWGNCGIEYAWNNNNLVSYTVYTDENWQPMRIPLNRRTDDQGSAGIMRINYQYDNYGRTTKVWYTMADGDSCITNAWGVHQIAYEYDYRGNETRVMHYDNHGALTANTKSGVAFREFQYDEQGHLTNRTFYDEHRQLCSKPGYVCRMRYAYNEEGRQTLEEQYIMRDGQETLGYRWIKTADREEKTWDDGSRTVKTYDNQGRETLYDWYDAERPEKAWKRKTEYQDLGKGRCIKIVNFYDENGNPDDDGVFRRVGEYDSLKWTYFSRDYDLEGNLLETFRQQYDEGFKQILMQQDVNAFGVVCRAGGSGDMLCYAADVWYTPMVKRGTYVGRDEFGEPDYVSTYYGFFYHQLKFLI